MKTNQVIRAMKPSFLFWSPPANSPGFKGAAKELRARKQPYLAVVHMNEKPPRKTTVRSLHHFKVRWCAGVCVRGGRMYVTAAGRSHPYGYKPSDIDPPILLPAPARA